MLSIAWLCAALAAILAVVAITAGFGTRIGWWGYRTGLSLLKWSACAELAIAAFSLAGSILAAFRGGSSGLPLYLLAFVISIASVIVPFRMYLISRSVPAIHDITTDTENPPQFNRVLGLRKGALNPAEYGGPEIAQQQKKAYPDIAPLTLEVPPEKAFDRALIEAGKQRWQVVNADKGNGLIEATDTTFWFGFRDDIVIRITPEGNGSRVDLRSLSRVGRSDVGANAGRIRRYLNALKKGA
ncbi:MAG: DUF1499 domain-containing protein [Nitrospirae bacterium]|nr:DUF1499 domain-containing protein [Nitrospirota bacterium]